MPARQSAPRLLAARAAEPVDGSSLAAVRVVVGAVGVLSAARVVAYGWIDRLYAGPAHRFTYLGLGWVPQPGPTAMAALVAVLAGASLAMALGWRTRVAAAVLLGAFAWVELIDATTYLNHYWFLTLVLALGTVVPWGAAGSLDTRRRGGPRPVARGWVWLLRFQVGVVYASAGVAKLQGDWLLRAEPLRLWLPARSGLAVVGPALEHVATAHVLSVAGAAFDCAVVPLLLARRTRPWAWGALVAFHVSTWALFPIGVFPWLMVGAATVFFAPDWPRALASRARARWAGRSRAGPGPAVGPATVAAAGGGGGGGAVVARPAASRAALALATLWVVVQLALPVRHLAYGGDHRWSAQGYRFAWNVLLTEKAGSVTFLLHEPATGRRWATDGSGLYTRSQRQVMATEPDLIHQAARALAAQQEARGRHVEVRVDAWLSLNGHPPARLIDPAVDLAARPRDLWDDPWILPRPADPPAGAAR
ncbi:MAG TPA: HTTM domain-containing protein [Acidimicrobiales bacterium]|nr:HTTM domain-containing protein [Acidimicrobiales bacterium]